MNKVNSPRSDTYRRLLRLGHQLASQRAPNGSELLIDDFLKLASNQVALDDPRPRSVEKAHVEVPLGQHSGMPSSVERMFEAAIQRCGIHDFGSMLLLAASIDAIRTEAVIEEPGLLREEELLRF